MLAMPQMRATSSLIDPKDPTQKVVTYEGSASPRELLESCVIQAQAALKGLKSTKMSASDPEIEEEEAKRRLTVPEVKAKEKGKQASAADAESEQFKTFWRVQLYTQGYHSTDCQRENPTEREQH